MDINLVTFKMVTSCNHFIILFLIWMHVHWCFSCTEYWHVMCCHREAVTPAVTTHLVLQIFSMCIWIVFYVKQSCQPPTVITDLSYQAESCAIACLCLGHTFAKRKSQNGGTVVEHCSCRQGDSVHRRNWHCWGLYTRHFSHTEELSHSTVTWSRFSWTFTSVGLILLSLPYFFWFRVLIHGQNNLVTTSYRHHNGYYGSQEVSLVKIIIDGFFQWSVSVLPRSMARCSEAHASDSGIRSCVLYILMWVCIH